MSSPPLSWRRGRFLWSVPVFLLLQYIDNVVVVFYVQSCGRQSSSHSCSLDKVIDMPFCVQRQPVFNVQKTAVVPQLLRVFWWPVSLLCRSCWCRFLRLWTPCDHAATSVFSSTVEVPQIQLSPVTVDIPVVQQRRARFPTVLVMTAMSCFWRILRHFSRSSGYPGVERQFFEPSTMKSSSSSRAPRGAGVAGSFTPS